MDERFAITRDLPRGTFGRTVVADVLDDDLVKEYEARQVVLKIPDEDGEELGSQEFATAWSFRSRNLVRYFRPRRFEHRLVLVMEYVPDGDLRDWLRRHPSGLSPVQALSIVSGILAGLAVIHQHDIVHRDLKPENVVMDGIVPKICDFGLAKLRERNRFRHEGDVRDAATVAYMAPEAITGVPGGAEQLVDIWAAGVVLYELLTGRRPFDSDSPEELIDRISRGEYRPATSVNAVLTADVDDVVAGALSVDPHRRYQNAVTMQQAVFSLDPRAGFVAMETYLQEQVTARPDVPTTYEALARFFNESTRHFDALSVLTDGVARCPESGILRLYKAGAHDKLGEHAAALAELERALALGLDGKQEVVARRLEHAIRRRLESGSGSSRSGVGRLGS